MTDGPAVPRAGMTISVRTRRDVVITDPERFLAAARTALRELNPGLSDASAIAQITDVHDAVHALLDRHGELIAPEPPEVGRGAPPPGARVADRPDGMSPAGFLQQIELGDPLPLQDYGCLLPEDPFALPGGSLPS